MPVHHCAQCGEALSGASAHCPSCLTRVAPHPGSRGATESFDDIGAVTESDDGLHLLERVLHDLRSTLAPRYRVDRKLGRGGMGTVFLGYEPELRRAVAIKLLSPELATDITMRARFEREARSAAELSYPNVVSIHGIGETHSFKVPYIVMQYIDGETLAGWIEAHPQPPERTARRLLGEVAAALAAAHACGLVHRDVKPSNVLIEGGTGRAYLADFGLAAPVSPWRSEDGGGRLTSTGQIVGTLTHMSPEQLSGEGSVGPESDVYSFGMLAYELLAGKLPFEASSAAEWFAAHLRDVPPSLSSQRPDISPEIAQIIDRCLAKDKVSRPTARALEVVLLPTIVTEVAWPPPGTAGVRRRGRRLASTLLAAGAAALLALGALALPPHVVRAEEGWWRQFSAADRELGTIVEQDRAPEAAGSLAVQRWLWLGTLWFGTVGVIVLLPAAVAAGASFATSAVAARRAGWQVGTLADLIADPDGRSGLVISGGREMGAMDAASRAGVLQARRRQLLARTAAGTWAAGAAGTWAVLVGAGIVRPGYGAGAVAEYVWLLVTAGPALLLLGVAGAAALRERALLHPLPWRASHRDLLRGSAAEESNERDVAEWYAALSPAPGDAVIPSRGRGRHQPLILIASMATAVMAIWAAASLGTIVAGVAGAASAVYQIGRPTADLVAGLEQLHAEPVAEGNEAPWRDYLPAPSVSDVPDVLEQLSGNATPYAERPQRLLRTGDGELISPAAIVARAGEGQLSDETARSIAPLDTHPRTLLFRALARGHPADVAVRPASLIRAEAEDNAASDSLLSALSDAAHANLLVAASALSRGDRVTASQRLGENAAVAGLLLRTPTIQLSNAGNGMLPSLALLPLAEVESSRGGSPARAASLRAAAARITARGHSALNVQAAAGLAADASDLSTFGALLRDSLVAPGVRIAAFDALWLGACLNPREIVGGVDGARSDWLLATADSVSDILTVRALAATLVQRREPSSNAHAADRENGPWYERGLPPGLRAISGRLRSCTAR